jgi:hypothetical protein
MGFAGSAAWFEPPRVHAYWRVPFERFEYRQVRHGLFPQASSL